MTDLKLAHEIMTAIAPEKLQGVGNSSFHTYRIPYFFSPAGSLVQPAKKRLVASDLSQLEKAFQKHKPTSPLESKAPFICELEGQLSPSSRKLLIQSNWIRSTDFSKHNIWKKQIPLELPSKYSVSFFNYDNSAEFEEHEKLVTKCFKSTVLTSYLKKCLKRLSVDSATVNIRSANGVICATGSVIWSKGYGGLFSGCVHPRFRSRGLWNCLVAARQAISSSHGVKAWSLNTATKEILNKGDISIPFYTWRKNSI